MGSFIANPHCETVALREHERMFDDSGYKVSCHSDSWTVYPNKNPNTLKADQSDYRQVYRRVGDGLHSSFRGMG